MTGIAGNEKAHESVAEMLRGGFFGSLIFLGPAGVGKFLFAQHLLERVPLVDKLIVDLEQEKNDIDRVREIGRFMLTRPSGDVKAVVIRGADEMSVEAQNALLKTLEEPNSRGLIILIASRLSRLLPTVRSRSIIVRFRGIPEELTEGILKRHAHPVEAVRRAMRYFPHQPGKALVFSAQEPVAARPGIFGIDKDRFRQILLLAITTAREQLLKNPDARLLRTLKEYVQLYEDMQDYPLNEKIQYAKFIRTTAP